MTAPAQAEITVVVVTYNHVRFLQQALDSVVAQRTERPIEIIISEDCSTDGTTEIAAAFAEQEGRAQLILSPRNLRSNEVVLRAVRAASGRYLCLLDGDDYWTSPSKLEEQASVLDNDPRLSACFHNALIVRGDALSDDRWTPGGQPARVTFDDIWYGNPFATCAGMLRASALVDLDDWYRHFFPITDWPLYVLCAEHGDLAFHDEVVGAYRLHDGGEFTSLPTQRQVDAIARFYRLMDGALGGRAHHSASAGASRFFFDRAVEHAERGDRRLARACVGHSLRCGGVGRSVGRRQWLRLAWRLRGRT